MSETENMLDAFQEYYERSYNERMRKDLVSAIGDPPKKYLVELYKQVIHTHESKYGKLPDLAVISKVREQMKPVFAYIEQRTDRQITDDAGWTQEELTEALDKFRAIGGRVAEKRRFE